MTEAVDAIAVDVGDGAGRAEHEVAGHEGDAHRIARPKARRLRRGRMRSARLTPAAEAETGTKPRSVSAGVSGASALGSKPTVTIGTAIG